MQVYKINDKMRIFVLDNYDSFTFNLVHYLEELDCEVVVKRNDEVIIEEIELFDAIVLSPGPGLPENAGMMMDVIKCYANIKPILGVCLGMQAIAVYYGGTIENQTQVKHGVQEKVYISSPTRIFKDIDLEFKVGLYHSWEVKLMQDSVLVPTSYSENNVLMSLQHHSLPIFGVQFHPESILTEFGKKILQNFIDSCNHILIVEK